MQPNHRTNFFILQTKIDVMSTNFFGAKVLSDKPTPFVPRPSADGTEAMVLTRATIPASCKLSKGSRISLLIKTDTCDCVALATLIVSQTDNLELETPVDRYAEFSLMGPKGAEIHISGHYAPKDIPEDEEEGKGTLEHAFRNLIGMANTFSAGLIPIALQSTSWLAKVT